MIDAGTVVETFGVGNGSKFAERMVAFKVLGKQDKVIARTVDNALTPVLRIDVFEVLVLVVQRATGTVRLGTHDRLKLRLALLATGVNLIGSIEEILDAEHITMVGEGHGVHAVLPRLLDEIGNFRHAVKHRIVRVYVQVRELRHNIFFLTL